MAKAVGCQLILQLGSGADGMGILTRTLYILSWEGVKVFLCKKFIAYHKVLKDI